VLSVSSSGYYAWRKRPLSPRACADVELNAQDRNDSSGVARHVWRAAAHAELAAQGVRVGGKRVARLMRAAQLQGVSRRHFVTTRRDPTAEPAADLAQRDFHAAGPNLLWLADIVYIATGGGFV